MTNNVVVGIKLKNGEEIVGKVVGLIQSTKVENGLQDTSQSDGVYLETPVRIFLQPVTTADGQQDLVQRMTPWLSASFGLEHQIYGIRTSEMLIEPFKITEELKTAYIKTISPILTDDAPNIIQ